MCLLLLGESPGSTDEDPGSPRRGARAPGEQSAASPAVRAAYAKYECNHVYQTPSRGLRYHAPADLLPPAQRGAMGPEAKSLCAPASSGRATRLGRRKNGSPAEPMIMDPLSG